MKPDEPALHQPETGTPLDSLAETLRLLLAQVQAYERILPAQPATRAALAELEGLARRAINEAGSLAEMLAPAPPAGKSPFSPREFQVLELAARGLSNKEIAYRLGISERTAQFHMNSIFNKTGVSTRTEAVALALRQGWIPRTS